MTEAEWIDVKELLPTMGKYVLVCFADGGVDMTYRCTLYGEWFWADISRVYHAQPTHWAELPAAYCKQKKEEKHD
jgi:hypothetical protein